MGLMKNNKLKLNGLSANTKVKILSAAFLAVSFLFALTQATEVMAANGYTVTGNTVEVTVDDNWCTGLGGTLHRIEVTNVGAVDQFNSTAVSATTDVMTVDVPDGNYTRISERCTDVFEFRNLFLNGDSSTLLFTAPAGGGGGGGGGFSAVSLGAVGTNVASGAGSILTSHLGIVLGLGAALIGLGILLLYSRRMIGAKAGVKKK